MSRDTGHILNSPAVAYSYLRYSTPEQAKGDSVNRQHKARDAYLEARPHLTLDTVLQMDDKGRSAYKRNDFATYALGKFVALVKSGKIAKGSYLLLENLDRLSREDEGTAVELLLSIVNAGIVVVQLAPDLVEFRKPVDMLTVMRAVLSLSLGHQESKKKSVRLVSTWGEKRVTANPTKIVTSRVPDWIKVTGRVRVGQLMVGGVMSLDATKAATVRRIFSMSIQGMGCYAIAAQLNAENIPLIGRTIYKGRPVHWSNNVVHQMLISRATIGEYQPCKGNSLARTKVGEPLAGYYPAVVTADVFHAAQAGIVSRRRTSGKKGHHVNIFQGLLRSGRGDVLVVRHVPGKRSSIIPAGALTGTGVPWISFPADAFESALLSQLAEVTTADIAPPTTENSPASRVLVLQGELSEAAKQIAHWEARLDDLTIADTAARKQADWIAKRKQLAADLAQAEADAACPASTAWSESVSLMQLLTEDNSDETRLKVKAALRRTITRIALTFWTDPTRPGIRRAHADIKFLTGVSRQYVVTVTAPKANRHKRTPGSWYASSAVVLPLSPDSLDGIPSSTSHGITEGIIH